MVLNELIYFDLTFFLVAVSVFIPGWVFSVLAFQLMGNVGVVKLNNDNGWVEFFWTVIPALAVSIMCYFNTQIILLENAQYVGYPLKITGRQWYWTYQLPSGVVYDSVMGEFIDSVGKPARLIWGLPYKLLVTSDDVIHSFSLPDFMLKVDAIPGRVNARGLHADRLGCFVGYCSELCGAGHSYMPIVVEIIFRGFDPK
uniref:cytochrome-c oxidase n=1 Tax=Clinostomum complanatum TaxID=235145 RepID=A0A0F6PKJ3_CLICO|nr:cytochrome c oxidase subunit II [Clinostomum complanatum]AJR28005.1 cytochrome c oxidase subunit II [Clinostomum complanatum]